VRELRGKVAVVTGAAHGIGLAICRALKAEGCRLALVDRDPVGLATAARELGDGVSVHELDLRDLAALEALPDAVVAAHGGIDLVVQNAGLSVYGVLAEQSADDLDRVFDVNVRAVVHGARVFAPHLFARRGHLVNLSSMASFFGIPYQSTYCASKSAVRGFTEAIRAEFAPHGVGVTAVLPGTIATRFMERAGTHDPEGSATWARLMQRYGTSPERVARQVVRAVKQDRGEIRVGWDAHLAALVRRLAPGLLRKGLTVGFARATRRA
jgi:short-subunit dehydrogenase